MSRGHTSQDIAAVEGRAALTREWNAFEQRLTVCRCVEHQTVRMYLQHRLCATCGRLAPPKEGA
jgi:hypothetical protein